MISVADTFDALTSHRPYRPAMSVEQAEAELERVSGSQLVAEDLSHDVAARIPGACFVATDDYPSKSRASHSGNVRWA